MTSAEHAAEAERLMEVAIRPTGTAGLTHLSPTALAHLAAVHATLAAMRHDQECRASRTAAIKSLGPL